MSDRDMLDRWAECHTEACRINDFLDYIHEEGWRLERRGSTACGEDLSDLLYGFFNVDPKRLEEQRAALLRRVQDEANSK